MLRATASPFLSDGAIWPFPSVSSTPVLENRLCISANMTLRSIREMGAGSILSITFCAPSATGLRSMPSEVKEAGPCWASKGHSISYEGGKWDCGASFVLAMNVPKPIALLPGSHPQLPAVTPTAIPKALAANFLLPQSSQTGTGNHSKAPRTNESTGCDGRCSPSQWSPGLSR